MSRLAPVMLLALLSSQHGCDGDGDGDSDAGPACDIALCPGDVCQPADELSGCVDNHRFLDCVAVDPDGTPCDGDAGAGECGFPGRVILRDCRDECAPLGGTCFSGADYSGCVC